MRYHSEIKNVGKLEQEERKNTVLPEQSPVKMCKLPTAETDRN